MGFRNFGDLQTMIFIKHLSKLSFYKHKPRDKQQSGFKERDYKSRQYVCRKYPRAEAECRYAYYCFSPFRAHILVYLSIFSFTKSICRQFSLDNKIFSKNLLTFIKNML